MAVTIENRDYALMGPPRCGNCLIWRQMVYLLGTEVTVDDFRGRGKHWPVARSHYAQKVKMATFKHRIGLIRDPRDAYLSHSYFTAKHRVGPFSGHFWKTATTGFAVNWKRVTDAFEPEGFKVFRYEDMIAKPVETLLLLADAMEVERPADPEAIIYAVRPETAEGHVRTVTPGAWNGTAEEEEALCGRLRVGMKKYGYE